MIPDPHQVRGRVRRALRHLGRQLAHVYRPDFDDYGGVLDTRHPIGCVAGYPYSKATRQTNIMIALPGQLDENDQMGDYFMALYGSKSGTDPGDAYDLPDIQKDDILVFPPHETLFRGGPGMADGREYRVLSARDVMGAYKLYQIKEI